MESLPGPTASALPKARSGPADVTASTPTSHRRMGCCSPPALRRGPPRPIPDWTPPHQTGQIVAQDRVALRAGHRAGLAHPTHQDRQPRADAARARFDTTPPTPNRNAAFHPSADSSVVNTQRHPTHPELFCKEVGLHYTQLHDDLYSDSIARFGNKEFAPGHPQIRDQNLLKIICTSPKLRKLG